MRRRIIVVAGLAGAIAAFPARAALAHGGGEDFTARDLVEQAIGLLQGQPEMTELIDDRIRDALEDDEAEAVDLELVAQARTAVEQGKTGDAIDLLARSIGERVGPALHQPEVGGGLQAPHGTAGIVLVVLAGAFLLSGGLVAMRVR